MRLTAAGVVPVIVLPFFDSPGSQSHVTPRATSANNKNAPPLPKSSSHRRPEPRRRPRAVASDGVAPAMIVSSASTGSASGGRTTGATGRLRPEPTGPVAPLIELTGTAAPLANRVATSLGV